MEKRLAESSAKEVRAKKQRRGESINLVYPFEMQNQFPIAPPFINVGEGLDISNLTLSLKLGPGLFINDQGQIALQGEAKFQTTNPLFYNAGSLELKYRSPGLKLTKEGELSVPALKFPLIELNDEIALKLFNGLTVDSEQGLTLALDPIFKYLDGKYLLQCGLPLFKENELLQIRAGNGLALQNSQLECSLTFDYPLVREGEIIKIDLGPGMILTENRLAVKPISPLQNIDDGIGLQCLAPLEADVTGLGLKLDGTSLKVESDYLTVSTANGLSKSRDGLEVKVQPPLFVNSAGLALALSDKFFITAEGKLDLKFTEGGAETSDSKSRSGPVRTPEQRMVRDISAISVFRTKNQLQIPITYKEISGLIVYIVGDPTRPLILSAGDLEEAADEPESYALSLGLETLTVVNNSALLITKFSDMSAVHFEPASAVGFAEIKCSKATIKTSIVVSASTVVKAGGNRMVLYLKFHGVGKFGTDPSAGTLSQLSILTTLQFVAVKL